MIPETTYRRYLAALLAGDRAGCAALSRELLETGLAPEDLYTDLFQRSLYEVGELWEQNRVSVAVEHLATAVTESLLAAVYPHILGRGGERRRKAVISCSVNEYHQVGARMVADIMETRGWDTWFLGANTPTADLLRMLQEKEPDMLGLSVSIYFNMAALLKMIETVRAHYPGLDIIVGGQAFRWGGSDMIKPLPQVICAPSLEDLLRTIDTEYSS
ncbi:MAG: B12-binding domain-containing protein [Desulfosudaceae bacterium]